MTERVVSIRSNTPVLSRLLLMVFLGAVDLSWGQGLYNESSIYLNGAALYVDGEINNRGDFVNNGYVAVTNDWESNGTYKGKGVLELNGNGPQRISHQGHSVSSLVVSGWGTKYIRGALKIQNEFHLTRGIVEVSANDELSLAEKTVIFGGSRESYVDGPLTMEGSGYRFFPIGKNGTYAPIEFLDIKGKDARYTVEVFAKAPMVSVTNVIVRNGLYWERTQRSGTFDASHVAISYDPALFTDPEKMVMLGGTDWETPFQIISEVKQSSETAQVITKNEISAPILMLGEISPKWKEGDFYFPTALSPHARIGANHEVKIFGQRLAAEQFHLTVFNRWGALVYETRSLDHMVNNGWDGRSLKGDALAPGAYPYRLTGKDKTGRNFERKGVITILY